MRFFFLFLCFFPYQAPAKLFQNSYISFEVPEEWECKSFGTDWVCHSKLQGNNIEALITSTAKIAGPNDILEEYQNYLQQPKSWVNIKKEQIVSEKVTEAKKVFINKFPWIDGIHKNSEIKSYISRYVATICCDDTSSKLGILVVLSAHQDHYTKYSADFVKTVNTLRVMDIEKAISKVRASQATGAGSEMSSYLDGLFTDDTEADAHGADEGAKILGLSPMEMGSLIGLLFVVLAYFFIKKRKGGKKRRRSRRRK